MVSFSFERLFVAFLFTSLANVYYVSAAPIRRKGLDLQARTILARATHISSDIFSSSSLASSATLSATITSSTASSTSTATSDDSSSSPDESSIGTDTSTSTSSSADATATDTSHGPVADTPSGGVPSAPHFLVYGDEDVKGKPPGPPAPADIKGFNIFAISFLMAKGASDKASEWQKLSASKRASIKSQYEDAGIKLIVSAFGAEDKPTTQNHDPVQTANTMADWVKKYGLDGIDVDYEDLSAMNAGKGKAEEWLISFTKQLRTKLPQGQYIITHAPLAPWFSPKMWGGGGYLKVHKEVGSMIDWYNVQFYNQGSKEYTTCDGLLNKSSKDFPKTSVFEIIASGIPQEKLVIGKPPKAKVDADTGYVDPNTLATCVADAKKKGWNAGISAWEFPDGAASWIKTVRGSSWPV